MAIDNNIALAVKYLNDPNNFNQIYKKESLTADLENVQLKFLDAKTIKLPTYGFSKEGMGTYNRNTGTRHVDLIEDWKNYTLTQDNGDSLYLDVLDDEETLSEGMIRRANEFTRQNIIPAIDGYRFSIISRAATTTVVGARVISVTPSNEHNIIARIDDAFTEMKENKIPMKGTILYVTPSVRLLMQRSKDIMKQFNTQAQSGVVDTIIEYYNRAKIVEVPSDILGEDIEFMLVQPKLLAVGLKFNESRLVDATATTSNLFGTFWKYRINHDIFFSEGAALPTQFEGSNDVLLVNPGVYVQKNDYSESEHTVTFTINKGKWFTTEGKMNDSTATGDVQITTETATVFTQTIGDGKKVKMALAESTLLGLVTTNVETFEFIGWFYDNPSSNAAATTPFNGKRPIRKDTTLYARYKKIGS